MQDPPSIEVGTSSSEVCTFTDHEPCLLHLSYTYAWLFFLKLTQVKKYIYSWVVAFIAVAWFPFTMRVHMGTMMSQNC